MGKKGMYTGSRLLGEELRRLRGPRTLSAIAEFSHSEAFGGRIAPLSSPTLSQVENGISMPSVETLHALALIYKVSPQRLLDLIVEDRLVEGQGALLGDPSQRSARFAELLGTHRRYEALAVAVAGEREASTPIKEMGWRANRAACLSLIGFPQDAAWILAEIAESRELDPVRHWRVLQALADAFVAGGLLESAATTLTRADAVVPPELPARERLASLISRARIATTELEWERSPPAKCAATLRQVLDRATRLAPQVDDLAMWHVTFYRAILAACDGNTLLAMRDLGCLVEQAIAGADLPAATYALQWRGRLRRENGDKAAAVSDLSRALEFAAALKFHETAFELCFALYELAAATEGQANEASAHLRRCARYLPFVVTRSPIVVRFEAMGWKALR